MFGKAILTVVAALGVASAQTGPGFPVPATQALVVKFGNNTVSPAGELIPGSETANPPNISTPRWGSPSDHGVLMMVDLDVPLNNTRVTLLHWLSTDVTLEPAVSGSNSTPLVTPNAPAVYLQPSPPVGDIPHSYNLVLFQQPANFSIPAKYSNLNVTNNRIGFNVSQFVRDTGLGQPLAGSYFHVQNLSGTATTTYPPARTPTSTSAGNASSPVAFPGAATHLMGERALWVGISTVFIAGFAAFAL